jgi:hypothetical protein
MKPQYRQEDQSRVEALGLALPSILKFMFDTDCTWEIDWQKIDLSERLLVDDHIHRSRA